jgi:uncharacterized membrane protein
MDMQTMKMPLDDSPTGNISLTWLVSGVLLLMIGVILFVTLVLNPTGIAFMTLGIVIIISTFLRASYKQRKNGLPKDKP